jgi:hypothetical protein
MVPVLYVRALASAQRLLRRINNLSRLLERFGGGDFGSSDRLDMPE